MTSEKRTMVPAGGGGVPDFESYVTLASTLFDPDADWNRMEPEERAAILKTLSEFSQSPLLREAIEHMENEQIKEIVIRWGNDPINPDGTISREGFDVTETGRIIYAAPEGNNNLPADSTGRDIRAGTTVVITFNDRLVRGAEETAKVFMHELRHPVVPRLRPLDGDQVVNDERKMFNDIWKTNGDVEENEMRYMEGQTVVGSYHGDIVTSGATNDTLAGLSVDDILDGGGGDDLVMGGAGLDIVSGGLGSNAVQGGLGADTYAPAVGVTHEQVSEIGGVDRIDLSSVSIGSVLFMRFGDDLFILAPDIAVDGIGIAGQWLDASRVEQFTFAEGTYAASYIESLAGQRGPIKVLL